MGRDAGMRKSGSTGPYRFDQEADPVSLGVVDNGNG